MSAHHDRSVEELRRESERSRAALTSTVGELREKVSDTAAELKTRISPSHIKEEVKDYIRAGSEEFLHSVQRKARENPLKAVAIGAGLAYPLWGLLRTIPVPIMLIGAGLWVSRQKPGAGGHGFGEKLATKAADLGNESASRIADSARDAGAALSSGVASMTDKATATAHDVRASVAAVADKARAAVHDARDAVGEMRQSVADTVADSAASAKQTISEAASDVSNKAAELTERSRTAFVELVDRNPLVVGGVGLAIGAFIAACLPRSDTENRLLGKPSDDVKDMVRAAASQGVERAKGIAANVADDVAAAAAREGLSPEGVGKAMQGLTEGIKSVVDRGLKTAVGEKESQSPSIQPGKGQGATR